MTESCSFASVVLVEDDPLNYAGVTPCVQFHDVIVYWPTSVVDTPPADFYRSSSPTRNTCEDTPTPSHIGLLKVTVYDKVLRASDKSHIVKGGSKSI